MLNVTDDAPSRFEAILFERIVKSERFKAYQDAFRTATGLPLRLVDADTGTWCLDDEEVNRSPFCEALNLDESSRSCLACVETNRQLMEEAESKGATTCSCFAGLCSTAVPVHLGASIIGFLKTGQVFREPPSEAEFNKVFDRMADKSISKKQLAMLKSAWLQTRTIEPSRYESMVKLLNSFAEQLSQHAESLAIVEEGNQSVAIAKARKYIHARLDQPLPLRAVSHQAGLSESHFCRLFKEATGLTLTDYVNRCRVDWAKRELMRPEARISEIAFLVGYQSISQFNRSFARIVGHPPTSFRRHKLARSSS